MPYLMQAAALQFRLLDQITILVGQQMALDLRHCIDRDVYHDQQTSASQIERYTCFGDQEFRNSTNQRKISCTDHGGRKSTRLNSSHYCAARMSSSACKQTSHQPQHHKINSLLRPQTLQSTPDTLISPDYLNLC